MEAPRPEQRGFPWLGAAASGFAFLAQLVAAFVLAPVLLHHLGHDRYGAWSLVESLLAYFTLFDLGISATIVRYVSQCHATKDYRLLNRVLSASTLVFLGAGFLVATLGTALLTAILHTTDRIPEHLRNEVWWMTVISIITLAVQFPCSIFPASLDGLERFTEKAIIRTAFLILRVLGVFGLVHFEGTLPTLAMVFAATTMGELLVTRYRVQRLLPFIAMAPWRADKEALRLIRGYSTDALLAMLAGRISFKTDAIVIGLCGQLDLIPFFDMPARLTEYAKNLIRSATTTLTPTFSALEAKGHHQRMRELFLTASRYAAYLALPMQLGLILFGGSFLERWLGDPEFRHRGQPVLWILAGTISVGMLQSVAARVLYGTGRIRVFARLMLLEAGINLSLSLALFPFAGINGVALGTLIPNIALSIWIVISVCQTLHISDREYVQQALLRPLLATMFLAGVWQLRSSGVQVSWLSLLRDVGSGCAIYLLLAALLESIAARIKRSPFAYLR
jgi:O-antigen/teichoic acid export membrane protein